MCDIKPAFPNIREINVIKIKKNKKILFLEMKYLIERIIIDNKINIRIDENIDKYQKGRLIPSSAMPSKLKDFEILYVKNPYMINKIINITRKNIFELDILIDLKIIESRFTKLLYFGNFKV